VATAKASAAVLIMRGYGGMELCGRPGVTELPMFKRLRGVSALQAWSGPALAHLGGTQHQAAATAARPTPDKDVQTVGTNMTKNRRLGT
jgi:hypothetical protein